jgi:hypothetical protein
MIHRSSTHQHGVLAGLLLAVGVVAAGFLIQSDLARTLHGGGQGLVAGGVVLAVIVFVVLRLRSK